MWNKWLLWKYIVRRLARTHGFTDPILLLSHIRRFSQPSEVQEPVELLRAGVVLHARGLLNSRVIQHNLDWIWPYWVNQQFNPRNKAFIPRAFSLTHINLSARNWTSVGHLEYSIYPIIDPRGLIMPFWDSWSIDAWVITDDNEFLVPSRLEHNVKQKLVLENNISVQTNSRTENIYLQNKAEVNRIKNNLTCCIDLSALSQIPGWLVVSLRPYNPEGISFIHEIEFDAENIRWNINHKNDIFLKDLPDKQIMSNYEQGDVALKLLTSERQEQPKVVCGVGMATAAAMYRLKTDQKRVLEIQIPINNKNKTSSFSFNIPESNNDYIYAIKDCCKINLPFKNYQYLYDSAVSSILLHSPDDVYPGPFTYKRFWFRDAAFIIYAMLRIGMYELAEKLIDNFLPKQTAFGYFHSQEGEWDSNGQVLWLMNKYCDLTGRKSKDMWLQSIVKAGNWIIRKRLSKDLNKPHAGLLPAGFSAEHFGPNDFYYWDDFWAVAGLKAASKMIQDTKYEKKSKEFSNESNDLLKSIEKSLASCRKRLGRAAIPASPYRRLDSGTIGSISACYPLELFPSNDERVLDTINYLMEKCILNNSFFHDISHSGINPYLTLQLAQVLMRIRDNRFIDLVESIAKLASPTGQWPEAINPRTGLGCMGDGQHVWASAEWVLMMVNSFVMQQEQKLIIGAGVSLEWFDNTDEISAGPLTTEWGYLKVKLSKYRKNIAVECEGSWHSEKPEIEIRLPGYKPVVADIDKTSININCLEKE